MDWKTIESPKDLNAVVERSKEVPCLIFKHSTRCSISTMAKYRLEDDWDFSDEKLEAYYLDLISYRSISKEIVERFKVHHESPQVLLIKNGECTYDASHLDITVNELHEIYAD
jgi:bacillithiol system protein YtxJ